MFTEDTIEKSLIEVAKKVGWEYVPADSIPRDMQDVLVGSWLKDAILRLNEGVTPSQAEEVIYRLRSAVQAVQPHDLVTANERFKELIFEKNSYPFGKDGDNIPIAFFDYKNMQNNHCVITNQWMYPKSSTQGGKRLDIVLLINGIPLVIGEIKSPVRSSITWADGANDILSYEQSIPQMFVPNILNFATEGKTFRYGGIGAPLTKWGPWFEGEVKTEGTVEDVHRSFTQMIQPVKVLDIMRFFTLYSTDKKHRKIKIVCRYQQYEGANAIVERVKRDTPKRASFGTSKVVASHC